MLVKTSQLSSARTAGKRYADTGVLVSEIWANSPTDERTIEAFARLNYIHGHYIQRGLISNEDLLFTLAQFMCEPIKCVSAFCPLSPSPLLFANGNDLFGNWSDRAYPQCLM